MNQVNITDLSGNVGKEVTVKGWVYTTRSIGKIWFVILRDGTGLVQCVVVKEETDDETFKLESILTQESSVIVTGTVREEARSVGGFELGVKSIEIVQISKEFPISPKEHGTDFLMNHRHLWIRSKLQHAILRVRHQIIKASRDFFDQTGLFLLITLFLQQTQRKVQPACLK